MPCTSSTAAAPSPRSHLRRHSAGRRRDPGVPDAPRSVRPARAADGHPESLFDFPLVHYVRDGRRFQEAQQPARSGRHHRRSGHGRIRPDSPPPGQRIGDHRNIVLFVGYQAEHTLGRRIQEGATEVRIFGQTLPRRAEVETIGGLLGPRRPDELRAWVRGIGGPIRRAFVVHGEPDALEAMAEILREEGVQEVVIPRLGQSFEL